jgi:glycine oxidase
MSADYTTEVAIVGGGVIGSAIAYFLRQTGVEVTLIERAEIAAEASSAAAGLLSPLGAFEEPGVFVDLVMASRVLILRLIPELEDLSGESMEYRERGSLRLASNDQETARLRALLDVWQALGWQVNWLTGEEVRALEPRLAKSLVGAVQAPEESSIRPPGVTRAYAGAACKLGARLLEYTEVTGFERSGSRVVALRTSQGGRIACGQLVIATGAWSADMGRWLDLTVPVEPVRGQILALQQPPRPLEQILFGREIYLVPKPDDTIFVGATSERAGFDRRITAAGISWLLSSAIDLMPELAEAPIARMWAGLRPWSADGKPILGHAPGWENVILATGHSGMGFETSAISGQSIAELLTTGQIPALIRPFTYERFLSTD